MSPPDVIANMSRGWNRNPAGLALGTEQTGVSAAYWAHDGGNVHEVTGSPDRNHILSIHQRPLTAETFHDGRMVYSMHHAPGMISLVRADQVPRAVIKSGFGILHIYMPDAHLQHIASAHAPSSDRGQIELIDPANARDAAIERIGREMLAEMRGGEPLSRLRIDTLAQDVAVQLLRRWSNLAGNDRLRRAVGPSGLAPWQVKRATEFLYANLGADVSLTRLADLVDLSPFHFARAFKRSTGLPPHRFLMACRCEKARDLLRTTRMSLAEIALVCGFAGQSHFTTAFKRHMDLTPGAWRAAVRH